MDYVKVGHVSVLKSESDSFFTFTTKDVIYISDKY